MSKGVGAVLGLVLAMVLVGLLLCLVQASPNDPDGALAALRSTARLAFDSSVWGELLGALAITGAVALALTVAGRDGSRATRTAAGGLRAGGPGQIREVIAETREQTGAALSGPKPDVIAAFNALIRGAQAANASDIHLSPMTDQLEITFRVDGTLHEVIVLPPEFAARLTIRAKVLAHLDTHVRNIPQDGRLTVELDGKKLDARMSSMPTEAGERVALRLLQGDGKLSELEALGFNAEVYGKLKVILERSQGLLLVTGTVGSGKTTSLYASLHDIAVRRGTMTSIVTLEDPIETKLPFATQTQINARTGMTFAAALRSALRQDPNVLMVGEIRDRETANIAVEASLTGHLLLTTVHADSAAGPFARLIELEVEPFLLASATVGCLSQRLVRRLCTACRCEQAPDPLIAEFFERRGAPLPETSYYEPVGCDYCEGSGFAGRVPIAELLVVDTVLRKSIHDRRPSDEIYAVAVSGGMTPLIKDGLSRATAGETSLAEVMRVAG